MSEQSTPDSQKDLGSLRLMSFSRPLYRFYEDRLVRSLPQDRMPHHMGVILDGHRRFARRSGRDYADAYRAGMDKFVEMLGWCEELRIPVLSAWLLSQENLERPDAELAPYYRVLRDLLDRLPDEVPGLEYDVIGSLHLLPDGLQEAARDLMQRSSPGGHRLNIGLAYGGRQEIVDAVRDLVAKLAADGVAADQISGAIDSASIASHLYTADLPDPDLVIRTSGESRLSGFLLWQAAYAEYSFVDVYWPGFRRVDFLRAIRDYTLRQRRFGR